MSVNASTASENPPMTIACPKCARALSLPEKLFGQTVCCPFCKWEFRSPNLTRANPVLVCPDCSSPVADGAVICIQCGYDFRKKKKVDSLTGERAARYCELSRSRFQFAWKALFCIPLMIIIGWGFLYSVVAVPVAMWKNPDCCYLYGRGNGNVFQSVFSFVMLTGSSWFLASGFVFFWFFMLGRTRDLFLTIGWWHSCPLRILPQFWTTDLKVTRASWVCRKCYREDTTGHYRCSFCQAYDRPFIIADIMFALFDISFSVSLAGWICEGNLFFKCVLSLFFIILIFWHWKCSFFK